MTSNQGAPKGADVVGEREGRYQKWMSEEARIADKMLRNLHMAPASQKRRVAQALIEAEVQLEVYREALERIEATDPLDEHCDIARAALREKP